MERGQTATAIGSAPREQGVLTAQLEVLERQVNALYEESQRLEHGLSQLLHPVPKTVADDKKSGFPSVPETIEGRLHHLGTMLQDLIEELADHVGRLERAL